MPYILTLLLALAMTMTLFGKSIIGIGLALCIVVSIGLFIQDRKRLTGVKGVMVGRQTIAILIMLGIWIVSASQGIIPDKSIYQVFEYVGIIFGGYLIFGAVQKNNFDFEKLFQYCVIGGTVCAGVVTLTPFVGDTAIKWSSSYGSVLALFIPMGMYLARENKWWWIAVLILSSGILASGGRTAWVALSVIVILSPLLMPRRSLKHYTMMIVVIGAGAVMGLQSYKNSVGVAVFDARTQAMQTMERPASGRLIVWDDTIDRIMEQPLLGYGIKSAQYLEISKGGDEVVTHVHNVVLEMMLETGVLGFLAFAAVILLFVGGFLRSYFRSDDIALKSQAMVIFLSAICYGVSSMALTSMFHAWWFLYLVVFVILLKVAELRLRP